MDALHVLISGRTLISDPANWTRGSSARGALGQSTGALNDVAVCWCTLGAIEKVCNGWDNTTSGANEAYKVLQGVLSDRGEESSQLSTYNDNNSHEEVLALWDAAIEKVK